MAGFGLAIFVLSGCGERSEESVDTQPAPGVVAEPRPEWMAQIEGTWEVVEGDSGIVRIYDDVLSGENEDGDILVVSLQPIEACDNYEYRAERLLRVTVEDSGDPSTINETVCWEVVELSEDRFGFYGPVADETYILERRAD